MSIEVLTKETFNQTIAESKIPVIVDFYADWCQPCKRISRTLEEIAEESNGKFSVYKVNTDNDPDLAIEYNVSGIPNIISFVDGKLHKRVVGVVPKEELLELVNLTF